MKDNFIVVIRAAGERTVKVCEKLISEEIDGKAECITIECRPFEKAIKKSFEIGIESGNKWLVTVDADVLIRNGGITALLKIGNNLPKNVFQYEGFLYDGLLLKYRQGGVKVYRVNLLAKALSKIPEPGTQIRPETYTQDEMAKLGYKRVTVNEIVGLHDYEQYSKDIYRKAFVHGRKFENEVYGLIPVWKHLEKNERKEYGVALSGGVDGMESTSDIKLDSKFMREKYKGRELNSTEINSNDMEAIKGEINNLKIDFKKLFLSKGYQYFDYLGKYGLRVSILWLVYRFKYKFIVKNK